jgi:hypothetical protein
MTKGEGSQPIKSHVLPETRHVDTRITDPAFWVAALMRHKLHRIYSRTRVELESCYKLIEQDTLYKLRYYFVSLHLHFLQTTHLV